MTVMNMRSIVIGAVALHCFLVPAPVYSEDEIDPRAVASFVWGVYLEESKDIVNAYRFYTYSENLEKGNGTILARLAKLTFEAGDMGKAKQYATSLLGSKRYDVTAHLMLARIETREGDREAAARRLLELIGRGGTAPFEAYELLAQIQIDLDDFEQARNTLEKARGFYPNELAVHYRLGFLYGETGENEKAIAAFTRAVEIDPEFSDACIALAAALRNSGRDEDAKNAYREVIHRDPTNTAAAVTLAEMLYEDNELDEGIKLIEPLYDAGLLDDWGRITLGKLFYRADRADDALRIFTALIAEKGDAPALLRVVSDIEVERGNFSNALTYLKRLVEIEPDNFTNYIGMLLIAYGLAGEAADERQVVEMTPQQREDLLQRALSHLDSGSPDDNYLIGIIYVRMRERDKALAYLLRAEQLRPDDRKILLELASIYDRRREFDEALRRVVHLYEKDPDDPSLNNFYGYLLAEKGEQLDLAHELLKKAVAKEPDNGYFLDSLGWVYFKKGDYSKALEILEGAARMVVDDPVILEHLGDAYDKLGHREKALEMYRKSLSGDPGREDLQEKLLRFESRVKGTEK